MRKRFRAQVLPTGLDVLSSDLCRQRRAMGQQGREVRGALLVLPMSAKSLAASGRVLRTWPCSAEGTRRKESTSKQDENLRDERRIDDRPFRRGLPKQRRGP